MTIAYGCVLLMILFPYLFTILAKTGPDFNNHSPREYLENLTGWRKRAHWIQLNSFEITPAFSASVIIAHQLQAAQSLIDKLAVAFVVSRVIYAFCYLADKATFRFLAWTLGLGCVIALFLISIH